MVDIEKNLIQMIRLHRVKKPFVDQVSYKWAVVSSIRNKDFRHSLSFRDWPMAAQVVAFMVVVDASEVKDLIKA